MLRLVLVAAIITLRVIKPMGAHANSIESLQIDNNFLQYAQELLQSFNDLNQYWTNKYVIAEWNYSTNLTDENQETKLNVSMEFGTIIERISDIIKSIHWQDLPEGNEKRQFRAYSQLGNVGLPPDDYQEFQSIVSEMENPFAKAKLCDYRNKTKCDLAIEPELTEILIHSRDPEELKYIWVEWRKASGEKIKSLYPKYVELANKAVRYYNFSDYATYRIQSYDTEDLLEQVEATWQQLKPLYLQLHAYVRRKLREKYGEDIVSKDGPIPAHLLGNMWAESWQNIANFTTPFPSKKMPDVTSALIEQNYNETGIFRLAEDFFKSINLSAMTDTFWERSILQKQKNVEMVCHATAWNFYEGDDYRIRQCTRINMEDLITAHHEMGHVEYFMQYKDQPMIFREGANPAFHEALGDVIALSVSTPKHLKKIGLLPETTIIDYETLLDHLYWTSMEKIAFMPFGYMLERWRWDAFRGIVTPDNYNCHWWSLKEEYQGIEPPVDRSEEDFDPGSKYHVVANIDYIRYFVSFVLQFQFHKTLCTEAKEYDPQNPKANPLHKCDIYNSKDAGNLLKSMLQMGSSKPWPDAMEKLTGQREMDLSGMVEYFEPLREWLEEENKRTNEYIGWTPSKKKCTQTRG